MVGQRNSFPELTSPMGRALCASRLTERCCDYRVLVTRELDNLLSGRGVKQEGEVVLSAGHGQGRVRVQRMKRHVKHRRPVTMKSCKLTRSKNRVDRSAKCRSLSNQAQDAAGTGVD